MHAQGRIVVAEHLLLNSVKMFLGPIYLDWLFELSSWQNLFSTPDKIRVRDETLEW